MESPVVLDKPPEYHGIDDRGFPFDEEEGGAWSEFVSRRPELAARLRPHTAAQATPAWARKRRPHSQEQDDFDSFGDFDRLIPEEFRGHFPSHFGRGRFGAGSSSSNSNEAAATTARAPSPATHTASTHSTAATQTDGAGSPPPHHLPQYGLRNTVDLGQRSAADPSLVDAEERGARSMSAPPDARSPNDMNAHAHAHAQHDAPPAQAHRERRIPIFVEGRDDLDFGAPKHNEEPPATFTHPPNYTRSFGTPFANQFRQGQPFTQQKVFPQNAGFGRSASPQRTHSPKPHHEEYVQVPVYHESSQHPRSQPKPQPPPQQHHQPPPPQQQQHPQPPPTQQQQHQPPPAPERQTPPPQQAKPANDPISQILEIQTNVLNLMADVEKFQGTKADKYYLYLDEMLTRNLIRLDDIDAEGKENIRNARKEAVRCIQKCIAVLEAKAERNSANAGNQQPASQGEAPSKAAETEDATSNASVHPTESLPAANESPAVEPASADRSETAPTAPDVTDENQPDTNNQPEPMAVDKTADSQMEVEDASASQ